MCGTFLYYAIAIYNTILPDLRKIYSEKSKATTNTSKQMAKILKYLASNPRAEIQYRASGMQLSIHSDVSYLSVAQSRREAGPVGSIFSAKVHLTPKIQKISCRPPTASYLFCARSFAISWRQQLRPYMAPSLSTPRQLYLSATPYLKRDGNTDPRPSKWTIALQWELQISNSSKRNLRPWICVSIG